MFDMNYRKIYDSIIRRAKKRTLPENKYVEVHHIVPKSFFSSIKVANQKNNLVKLLPEEHWICHLLLVKFCTGIEREKMKQAVLVMSGSSKRGRLKCTNKRYAKRKKASAYRKRKKKQIIATKKKPIKKKVTKQKFRNQKSFKSSKLKEKSKTITKAKKTKRRKVEK